MTSNRSPFNSQIAKYLAAVAVLITALLGASQAATLTVTNTNDSGAGSLRGAMASAAPGDTIVFNTAGVFATPQTITLTSGELVLNKSLTIDGPGANQLTINAHGASRVFIIPALIAYESNIVALEGLTIAGGNSVAGGGVYQGVATLTITNVSIVGNNASSAGGGIYNILGTLTVINSTISDNTGSSVAGIYNQFGTMTLVNSTVSGNFANSNGGGITNGGSLTVTNSTISNNAALTSGGGIYSAGTETLNNTIVAGNRAGVSPGDIFGTIDVANNSLIGDAGSSGGIANGVNGNKVGNAGVGTLDINTVLDISLEYNGGTTLTHSLKQFSPAIDAGSNALAAGLTTDQRGVGFVRVADGNGDSTPVVDIGAYELSCPALVTNTNDSGPGSLRQTIADACPNAVITFDTAGVFATPQTITLTSGQLVINKNLTIDGPGVSQLSVSGNNTSRVFNIPAGNMVAIKGLTISGGKAIGGGGGGISNTASVLTITNIAMSGNSSGGGGGIYNLSGTVTITNSTISGNSALGTYGGGVFNSGAMTLTNVTVSANSAQVVGGGIYNSVSLTLNNTTIVGNRCGLSENALDSGGGIFLNGTETLNNTIVAGNFKGIGSTPDDINGNNPIDTANNNLIGNASTAGGILNGLNGNKVGFAVSAVLDTTLADNGGPTKTHALVCGSPAIDAGSNALAAALTTDQRGAAFPRILDGNGDSTLVVDIGAFENATLAIPTISIDDVSLSEGDAGTKTFDFTVSLSEPAGACGVTFDIATQDSSATTADGDYQQKTLTTQTIPGGNSTYTFSVTVNGDATFESNEAFFVNLSNVSGAALGDAQGVGAIANDDLAPVSITVNTSTAGLAITVDGTPYLGSQTFNWVPGSNHTIATTSPQSLVVGTRYVFLNWSDAGAISHTVTTPASPTTYTANFKTQHQLTTSASTGGTISPASGFYDQGSVSISATVNAGFTFSGFSGGLTGTTNPQTLNLTGPNSVNANFTGSNSCGINVNPASLPQPYIDTPYLQILSASPFGNYGFSVSSGQLPPGLKLVTVLGISSVVGVPSTPGTYTFAIKADKKNSTCEATRTYTLTVQPTILPILNSIQRNSNGTYTAKFGYNNSTGSVVTIPVGSSNYFTPGNQNRGQVTVFQPGLVTNAFTITFTRGNNSNLAIWLLRGPDGVLRPVDVLTTSIGYP